MILTLLLQKKICLITIGIISMEYKRYQYYGPNGIQWTNWFPYHGEDHPTKQHNKLKIEYIDELPR